MVLIIFWGFLESLYNEREVARISRVKMFSY
jgi:hypothetical protein